MGKNRSNEEIESFKKRIDEFIQLNERFIFRDLCVFLDVEVDVDRNKDQTHIRNHLKDLLRSNKIIVEGKTRNPSGKNPVLKYIRV